jgi:hypothetical protein
MDAPAVASGTHPHEGAGALSVTTIVGSAVLAGVGLLGMTYWLITFRWLYFASLVPLGVGAYLLFTRATGPEHA